MNKKLINRSTILFTSYVDKLFKNEYTIKSTEFLLSRSFSNGAQRSQYDIFDRKTKLKQRNHTLKLPDHNVYDYLRNDFGYRLFDSLLDIKRNFNVMVELNCSKGFIAPHLDNELVKHLILCDSSLEMLNVTKVPTDNEITYEKVLLNDEMIPFQNDSIDIVISNLSLHWVNYLPLTFKLINSCLRPDGVFLASIFGGQTLYELRCSLQLAEIERKGGFSPHISPLIEPADIGSLLQTTGFNMPTIDANQVVINYPSMFELIEDLQNMGESNCSWNRSLNIGKDTLIAAASIYKEFYQNQDGTIPATFHIFNFIGWKASANQPKPARRGSGQISFKDIENLELLGNKTSEK